jgi:phage shock protein PspC (stress-responsive transcriptional regulator)
MIGGVSGGLGRYFGVDPILFRIAFVVLAFAGGAGLLAYIGLLAFVPADDGSHTLGRGRTGNLVGAALLAIVVLALVGPPAFVLAPALIPIAIVAGLGVLIWRAAGGGAAGSDPAKVVARLAIAALIGIAALGGFLGVGALAALGGGVVLAILAIVAGVALIATAFVGGPRWLILPALVLVLPLALVAAAGINFDGGVGKRFYVPASAADLHRDYRLGMGQLTVDMRDVSLPPGQTDVHVQVGIGEAIVRIPENACVSSDVTVGLGHAGILHRSNDGIDVAFADTARDTTGAPQVRISGDIGAGSLELVRGSELLYSGHDFHAEAQAEPACP